MTFEPYPHRSGYVLLAVALIFGLPALFLPNLFPPPATPAGSFTILASRLGLAIPAALSLYGAVVAFLLRYHLNRNGLVIHQGLTRYQIPFNAIRAIIPGHSLPPVSGFKGIKLAGLRLGRGSLPEYGRVIIRTTTGPANSLLVVTTGPACLISPRRPGDFVTAWQARRSLGPTQQWTPGIRRSWPLNTPLLNDPLTWWLLGAAGLLLAALYGYLSFKFAGLPPVVPVHFDVFGRVDRIADKITLFTLPRGGAMVLAANMFLGGLLYGREKMAAYLLWAGAIAMQLFLWIAALTLTI